MNAVRLDHSARGVLPADQGFGAADVARREVDVRLEVEDELFAREGALEVVLQEPHLRKRLFNGDVEEGSAAAARVFGREAGGVRTRQEHLEAVRVMPR